MTTVRVAAPERRAEDRAGVLREVRLADVEDDQQRLCREQLKAAQPLLVVVRQRHLPQRRLPLESGQQSVLEEIPLASLLRLQASLDGLRETLQAPLDELEVGEDELEVDVGDVARGVDAPLHVLELVVLEAAHDVHQGVDLAQLVEIQVGAALPFLHPRDVDELDGRGRVAPRLEEVAQADQPASGTCATPT